MTSVMYELFASVLRDLIMSPIFPYRSRLPESHPFRLECDVTITAERK